VHCFTCTNYFSRGVHTISWLSAVFVMYRCALCLIYRSDAGISKGNSHLMLKRIASQHSATSQGASVDLSSAIRLKKAGHASSDGILEQRSLNFVLFNLFSKF
jgi:hypothetical protein